MSNVYDKKEKNATINNKIGSSNSSDLNYVRPALCLDSNLHVTISNDIVKGKSCYILDLKNN